MLGRPKLHPHVQPHPWDWYIDLATIEVGPERWQVNDHEIDLLVFENQRYEVLDLDEFVDAIEVGSLQIELGLETIRSLHRLCTELDELNFSVDALLQRHAPSLPAFQPWDSVTAPR